MMKKSFLIISFLGAGLVLRAQQVDSIYFNLYTDSLKKGTYNYINVEGRYSNGRYLPLTGKELRLTASQGSFDGNSLFIDSSFKGESITVQAVLISNPKLRKEMIIYIKKMENTERLPTVDEILDNSQKPSGRRRRS